jgi:hypothetical protein
MILRVTGQRSHRTRGIGWQFVHVAMDYHSRVSVVAIAENERQESAVAFLEQVVAHYRQRGVHMQRVMDNRSAYQSKAFAALVCPE